MYYQQMLLACFAYTRLHSPLQPPLLFLRVFHLSNYSTSPNLGWKDNTPDLGGYRLRRKFPYTLFNTLTSL
jgi:hypothetical protein